MTTTGIGPTTGSQVSPTLIERITGVRFLVAGITTVAFGMVMSLLEQEVAEYPKPRLSGVLRMAGTLMAARSQLRQV